LDHKADVATGLPERRRFITGAAASLIALGAGGGGVYLLLQNQKSSSQRRQVSDETPSRPTESEIAPARPNETQLTNAFGWFKERFGNEVAARVVATPIDITLIAAIAVNESFYIWGQRFQPMPTAEILALCVGDTLDAPARQAFPATKAALLAAPRGAEMFQIAREALEALATTLPAYRSILSNPDKFVRQFGIFGSDLQFYRTDPDFFLMRKWKDFGECLARVISSLTHAVQVTFGPDKKSLSDFEKACVAIAYNTGRFDKTKELKQGFFDGTRYYGEFAFDNIRLARKVLGS
jgi:hypothetical protein